MKGIPNVLRAYLFKELSRRKETGINRQSIGLASPFERTSGFNRIMKSIWKDIRIQIDEHVISVVTESRRSYRVKNS